MKLPDDLLALATTNAAAANRMLANELAKLFRQAPSPWVRVCLAAGIDPTGAVYLHLTKDDYRALRSFRDVGKPFTHWLFVVADRVARGEWLAQRPLPGDELDPSLPGADPAPDAGLDPQRVREIVHQALERAPDDCRQLLERRYLHGEAVLAIARDYQRDNKKLSNRILYCLRGLRIACERNGLDLRRFLEDWSR